MEFKVLIPKPTIKENSLYYKCDSIAAAVYYIPQSSFVDVLWTINYIHSVISAILFWKCNTTTLVHWIQSIVKYDNKQTFLYYTVIVDGNLSVVTIIAIQASSTFKYTLWSIKLFTCVWVCVHVYVHTHIMLVLLIELCPKFPCVFLDN